MIKELDKKVDDLKKTFKDEGTGKPHL